MLSSTDTKSLWDPSNFLGNPASLKLWLWPSFKINPNSPDFRHKQAGKPCCVHVGPNPPFARNESKELSLLHSTGKLLVFDNGLPKKLRFHDHVRILNLIKSCQKEKNIWKTRRIHADVLERNLIAKDVYIANALITAYGKCGSLQEALEVFEQIPLRNVVSWNALIAGYTQNGVGDEALKLFKQMKDAGIRPDAVTYTCILKACGSIGSLEIGEGIDAEVRERGLLEKDVVLSTALLDMYSKCGILEKAQQVFEQLSERNVVCWNALIAGYAQNELGYEALKCFKQMQNEGIDPDAVTFICILKACGMVGSLEIGDNIGVKVREKGFLQKDIMLGNALVDMYFKCGAVEKAQEVFEQLPVRDIVSWNALIYGYCQNGFGDEALKIFRQMKSARVCPDVITYISVLKACGLVKSLEMGENVYVEVKMQGLLEKDIVLGTALVDMYSKCGAMGNAREVFEELAVRDVVTWNAMISGYSLNGLGDDALKCFRELKDAGVSPNAVTYICVLKACGIVGSLDIGEEIDAKVRQKGLLKKDVTLGNALVDMYSRCGVLEKAEEVFEQLPERNVVAWSSLITGYALNGLGNEALKCFKRMKVAGVCPDEVTYVCILKACGMTGSLEVGEDIVAEVRNLGLLQNNIVLGTSFVDMYSKCGVLEKARELFEQLPLRDVVSWNTLISGYGQFGQASVVFDLYVTMRAENIVPNSATFIILLNVCSHVGLIQEGEKLFDEMCTVHCLTPTIDHYTCMVDLFGRAGLFDKINVFLNGVPHLCHLPLFQSILGSCRKWRNVKLGRWAFEQSVQLDEKCAPAYICMGNIYATAGMQTEAE